MAITTDRPELLATLETLVGDVRTCRRVIIDIQAGQPVVIHVQRYGDRAAVDVTAAVVRLLDNPGSVEIREVSDGEAGRPR